MHSQVCAERALRGWAILRFGFSTFFPCFILGGRFMRTSKIESAHLLYGKEKLPVSLPPHLSIEIVEKPAMPLLSDPAAAVVAALAAPVAAPPLAKLAREARSACIVICDITRPVPNRLLL